MTGINYSILWKHRACARKRHPFPRRDALGDAGSREDLHASAGMRKESRCRLSFRSRWRTKNAALPRRARSKPRTYIGSDDRRTTVLAWNYPAVSRFVKFSRAMISLSRARRNSRARSTGRSHRAPRLIRSIRDVARATRAQRHPRLRKIRGRARPLNYKSATVKRAFFPRELHELRAIRLFDDGCARARARVYRRVYPAIFAFGTSARPHARLHRKLSPTLA